MGKIATAGKNVALNALAAAVTHLGLLRAQTPITGVTGEADDETFTKTAHGLSDGDLVILTEVTGGGGAFAAGDAGNANEAAEPYYVVGSTANTFQLAKTAGGSAVAFGTDITAATVTELVEISGGSPAYARKAVAFNSAAGGAVDDSTNGAVFDVPAAAVVDYVGGFSASTGGTLYTLDKVTQETFGAQGTYTVTDVDIDLNQ